MPSKLKQNRAERRVDHVVKRRFHNSCHVCKCGASPGVEHVRCRCGIMFCGRPRCCKRLGVEWSVFVKELVAGGQCAHCNSLTLQGVADGVVCPNSNCKQKKKKGQESRKYSVGVVTSAQEVPPFSVAAQAAALPGSMAVPLGLKGMGGLLGVVDASPQQMSLSSFVPSIGSLSLQTNLPTVASSNPIASLPLSSILALLSQQQQQQQQLQSNAVGASMLPNNSSLASLSLPLAVSATQQSLLSAHQAHPHSHLSSSNQQQAPMLAAGVPLSSHGLSSSQLVAMGGSLSDGQSLNSAQLKLLQSHLSLSPALSSYTPQSGPTSQSASSPFQLHSNSHSHSHSQSPHAQSPNTQRITDNVIAALLQANQQQQQQQQLQALHNAHMRMQQQQSLYAPVAPIGNYLSANLNSTSLPPSSTASAPPTMEDLLAALIRQQQQQNQSNHSQPQHHAQSQMQQQQFQSQHHSHNQPSSLQQQQQQQQPLSLHHSHGMQSFGGIPLNSSLAAAYLRASNNASMNAGDGLSNVQQSSPYSNSLYAAQSNNTAAAGNPLSAQTPFSASPPSHSLPASSSPPPSHLASSSSPLGSSPVPASLSHLPPPAPLDGAGASSDSSAGPHAVDEEREGKWHKKMKRDDDWPERGDSGSSGGHISNGEAGNGRGGSTVPVAATAALLDGQSTH